MAPSVGNTLRRTWWVPLLCYGLAWGLAHWEAVQLLETRSLDWRTRYRALFQAPPDPRIVIALFEDDTELNMAPWPVDRAYHGRLNKYLALEKAAVVSWDVILDGSRSGAGEIAMARETSEAIMSGTRVVVAASTSHTAVEMPAEAEGPTRPLTNIEGDRDKIHGATYGLLPFSELRAVAWWGPADAPRGLDGIIREIPLIIRVGEHHYPALALQTMLVYLQVPAAEVRVKLGEAVFIPAKDRTWRIPIDQRGWFLLNYRYDQPAALPAEAAEQIPSVERPDFPTHSYLELLVKINAYRVEKNPTTPRPPDLADKIVFVGQTVTGKADAGPTPRGALSPLVLVHANILNNMLADDYARRAPDGLVWGLALLLGYAGIAGLAHRSVIILWSSTVLGVVIYAALATTWWVNGSWWLPVVGPLLGFIGLQSFLIGRRIRADQRTAQEIKGMFGTYVSPQVVDRLIKSGEPPQLGGHEAEITAYFSDIQGFSGFSEQLPPTRLVELMNEYFTACTEIVQEEGGTLNQYAGDAVVVMFGAPVPFPDHASRACLAALRVQLKLGELRAKWQAEGEKWPPVVGVMQSRIGLNSGRCVVGNMGSRMRFNYTMMGDDVNLAARMETGAKHWGVYTMCSEATRQACEQHGGDRVVFRSLGRIVVKGRTAPVPIYEIVGLRENLTDGLRECLDLFRRGLACFQARDWSGARALLERSAALEANIPGRTPGVTSNPSLVYLEIVAEYSRQPPAADWDGIFVMKEK